MSLTIKNYKKLEGWAHNYKDFRIGEKVGEVISGVFSFVFAGGLKKYKPISAENVAKSMVRISLNSKSGIHFFESDEISDLDGVVSTKI